jgi:hypothetical protein
LLTKIIFFIWFYTINLEEPPVQTWIYYRSRFRVPVDTKIEGHLMPDFG